MEADIPLVCVCVTTYTHAAYIRQCIDSVLAQEFDGTLEVLVGDDGSQDGTRAILEDLASHDSRVRPFLHAINLGPAGNLQFLVARARSKFIAHLDGDDFWLPGKLSAQLSLLNADRRVVAVYTNAYVVDAGSARLGIFNAGLGPAVSLRDLLRHGNRLNHSSLVYRSSARDAVLGIDKPFIDYRVHVRLGCRGALAYVDQPLVGYRWRTAGSMIRTMPTSVYQGHLDTFFEAAKAGASRRELRAAIGLFWGKLMIHSIASGQWHAIRTWGRLIMAEPAFKVSLAHLVSASILALPRAGGSWWRRRHRGAVFFP
ncbi:MAG TPA: glycosyltransferase [Rhodanobacter sp.]|jgi:glycosyltransferase involved in cell wall biosynthesis|nr:glycosyltransferase [Rhodanobacter sp.]